MMMMMMMLIRLVVSIYLSICNTLTFENLDLLSLFLFGTRVLGQVRTSGSSDHVKFT